MNKLLMIFEFVFGCWHRNLSRPFTLSGWTYEVCLNCGKKFAYDRAEISSGVAQRKNLARHERFSDIRPLGEPSLTGRDECGQNLDAAALELPSDVIAELNTIATNAVAALQYPAVANHNLAN